MNWAKVTHFTEQGYKIKGLIHAGANDGEEVPSYKALGIQNILCFEPLTSAYERLGQLHPDVYCAKIALGDYDGHGILNVTYGDGKGSSLLEEVAGHPEIAANWTDNANVIGFEEILIERLDHYFWRMADKYSEDPRITYHKIEDYDCLVLDTQGNEWEVLHGCGDLLKEFKYLSVELSSVPVYVGEHPGQEVIDWLVSQGFTQDTPLQNHNDVFFIRSDIKATSDLVYRGLA